MWWRCATSCRILSKAGKGRGAPGDTRKAASLDSLRVRIDKIDTELVALLDERVDLVLQVRDAKLADGDALMHRIEREEQIFARVASLTGKLSGAQAKAIFREIISACIAHEERQEVAYLGPPGTFSQQAVQMGFGSSASALSCNSIGEVVRAVETGRAQHGILPLENSSRGLVDESVDALANSELLMGGEILVPVRHCLMGLPDSQNKRQNKYRDASRIYSHPQSFAQCRNWLGDNLPTLSLQPVLSNGEAAACAAADSEALAIAPEVAAGIHGLEILHSDIQDDADNTTRFVMIGKRQVPPSKGADKTSLLVASEHKPGALLELLQVFNRHYLNLVMLYSRPSGQRNWSYSFFLDVDAHRDAPQMVAALKELQQRKSLLRVFGSYPAARPPGGD